LLSEGKFWKWKKAPDKLIKFLAEKMKLIKCEYRKMFGYPVFAYFINGNMFAGINGEELFLRLSEADIQKIMKENPETTFFEAMKGRPMKSYVVLPNTVYSKPSLFSEWLQRSAKYVSSLPPKQTKR
jgi:TfoX/Sxy family transcriptional regulator of competence genes